MALGMRFQREMRARAEAAAELERLRRQDADAMARAATGNAAFELLAAAVADADRQLRELPQGEARRERKKQLLAEFLPFAEQFLAGSENFANPVLMWCLVWSCDIGDLATAQRLALAAIERSQPMPPPFKSSYSVKTFWADTVLEWAQAEFGAGRSVNPYFPETFASVMEYPVHDIVKAKYCKLAAQIAEKNGDPVTALEHAKAAQQLGGEKAQVKTLLARLEKVVAAEAEAARHQPPESEEQ